MNNDEKEAYLYDKKLQEDYDFFIKECGILSIADELVRIKTLCARHNYYFYELLEEVC